MNRILVSLSAAAFVVASASAQCFEANFGTLLGTGDDTAFPSTSTAIPMNIVFPMGGTFATYDHIMVNTNGVAFLWNAPAGLVGGTGTGYSTSATTQLNNLRGAAGGAPRIAPLWRDLNLTVGNGAGLYLNTSIPGKTVITWDKAVNFGTTSPVFTIQAQLFDTGDIRFFYSGTALNSAATIAGVSEGGGIAAVAGVDLSAGGNSGATKLMFEQFLASGLDLQAQFVTFSQNGGGGYDQAVGACIPANNTNYGTGCYAIATDSFYQQFADASLAAPALSGNAMQLTLGPSGYTATWLPGAAAGLYYTPVTPTDLTTGDDGNVSYTLTTPFPKVGGSVAAVRVSGNGIVAFDAAALDYPGTQSYIPTANGFLNSSNGGVYSWHDYNRNEAGVINAEEAGGKLYITYDGVESYASPEVLNPSTLQFQFDQATGDITIVWVSVDGDASSTFGSGHIVGWTSPGASLDAGTIDLATALPLTTAPDFQPLALSAAPAPVSPSVMTYSINNIPDANVSSGIFFGVLMLSTTGDIPGSDLFALGAPGCNLHLGTLDNLVTYVGGSASQTVALGIPSGLSGIEVFAQAAAFVFPGSLPNGQNAFGAVTSNGVRSYVEGF